MKTKILIGVVILIVGMLYLKNYKLEYCKMVAETNGNGRGRQCLQKSMVSFIIR